MQNEGHALGGIESVEHHAEGEADRLGGREFALDIERSSDALEFVLPGYFAPDVAAAQLIETEAGHDRGEPGGDIVDAFPIPRGQPQPGLLHGVLGIGATGENTARDAEKAGALAFELDQQIVIKRHRSHPGWAARHQQDGRAPDCVTEVKTMQRVLVTGSTGALGRRLVPLLAKAGCEVRTLSRGQSDGAPTERHFRADMLSGHGLEEALAGVDVVAHCAGAAEGDDIIAQNLVLAARAMGRPRIVAVSVIGANLIPQRSWVDRKMFGYFGAKRRAEEAIMQSGLSWTLVRASQFHQLLIKVGEAMAGMPAIPVPAGVRFQPIDAGEVAGRVAELVMHPAHGEIVTMAGPEIRSMRELMAEFLRARGIRKRLVPLPLPGAAAAAFRRGANVSPDHAVGKISWAEGLRRA